MSSILAPRSETEYRDILTLVFKTTTGPFAPLVVGADNYNRVAKWGNSRKVVLKAAIRHALDIDRTVPNDTIKSIPRNARRRQEPKGPPPENILATIMDVATYTNRRYRQRKSLTPQTRRDLMVLLIKMGLRANELSSVTRDDLTAAVAHGTLEVERKGNKRQALPCKHVRAELERLLATGNASFTGNWPMAALFYSPRKGRPFNPRSAVRALEKVVDDVGTSLGVDLHPHIFRHAFATGLSRSGAPDRMVQQWLGHANISTTMLYLHPTTEDMEKFAPK